MKVIIDIDEGLYQEIIDNAMFAPKIIPDVKWAITSAMVNGTPLNGTNGDALKTVYEGMTNGEVLKAVFPNVIIVHKIRENKREIVFSDDCWNADYKGVE